MGKLIQIYLGVVMSSAAFAQSASNFNTHQMAPAAPAAPPATTEKAPAAKPKEAGPVSTTPSRFVGPAELESFVGALTSAFSMHDRETDPFGQPQDPNAKPVIKATVAKVTQRPQQMTATPFSEIAQKLVVTTIMPGEKRFLVGTRSIAQGERIPLSFRNKQIRVEVTEVTSKQIVLRNLDTGEIATRKLDILPLGMTPGLHGITAPGMVPDRPNAPIELDAGEPTIDPSQNR